jgi:serine/threonine protein kinase
MESITSATSSTNDNLTPWQNAAPNPTAKSVQRAIFELCQAARTHQQLTGDTLVQAETSVLRLQNELTQQLRAPAAFDPVRRKEVYRSYYEMQQLRSRLPSLGPSLQHCRESVTQADEETLSCIRRTQRNASVESLSELRVGMDVANSVYCCSPTEQIRESAREVRDSCMETLARQHAAPYKEKPLTGQFRSIQLASTAAALGQDVAAQRYMTRGERCINTRALHGTHTRYIITNTLGLGSFGKFRGGYNLQTDQLVGVKEHRIGVDVDSYGSAPLQRKTYSTDPAMYHQELELLRRLGSPCAPKDIIVLNNRIYWIMDLLRGDVAQLVYNKPRVGRLQVAALSGIDVALQLSRLHTLNYIHCDVKPDNILYNEGSLVLSDLGLAKPCREGAMQHVTGTWDFMPLEVLQNNLGGHGLDTWSLGITLLSTLAGQMPFRAKGPLRRQLLAEQILQFFRQRKALLHKSFSKEGLNVTAWPTAAAGDLSTLPCCAQISAPLVAYVVEHMLHPNAWKRPTLAQVAQTFTDNFERFTGGISEPAARLWLAQQTDHVARDTALRAVLRAHAEIDLSAAFHTSADLEMLVNDKNSRPQLPPLKF